MLGDDAGVDNVDNEDLWETLLAPVTPRPLDLDLTGGSSSASSAHGEADLAPGKAQSHAEVLDTANEGGHPATPTPTVRRQPDAVSLAFVFDSTGSMSGELAELKKGAEDILNATLSRPDKPIHDFVFVPFNDPGIGPATVTTDAETFKAQLDAVNVTGGSDCPEPSLAALLEALRLVRPNSFVYVFTDASAKDYFLLPDVLALVQRKQTQVVFVMTGNCKDDNTARYQSMENIATASSGQVYHINKTEVKNVLSFVRQTLESQKVNLVSVDLPKASKTEHAVQVDETIREFTVSVSGINPQISVVDPAGARLNNSPLMQKILDLDNVKVIAVKEPSRGSWTVETSSDSKHAIRLTGLSVVDFSYGFSVQATDRLDETYHRPLLGAPNFILVGGTDMGSVWNLTSVDLLAVDGSTLQTIPLSPLDALDGLYHGGPFVPPGQDVLFNLANSGYDKDGFLIKRITPTAISAQSGGLPLVELQSETQVWINGSLNLRCQIDSLLPFTSWFLKNGMPISKKQKYQQTTLMTKKIEGLTEEMGGEYACRASNVKGHSSDSVHIIVTGPPPEVVTESKLEIHAQSQVVLDCLIESKLKFNMTWMRIYRDSPRGEELVENNARYIILPNSSLVIDPALPEDTGYFSCVAENQGGRRESQVELLVYEPLHISTHPKSLNFQAGDSFSIMCEANTLPSEFYWVQDGHILPYKNVERMTVEVIGHRLTLLIKNAKIADQGVYQCIGTNNKETVEAGVEVYIVEMPSVKIGKDQVMVKAGDQVLIKCAADGIPKPKTRWLWQGMDVTSLSNFKVFEDGFLQIDSVVAENSGQLDCVANNSVGEVKDSVNLTVGYPPVVLDKTEVLQLEVQGSGALLCRGSGIPHPLTHWERKDGHDIDVTRIHHNSSTGVLLFSDAKVTDEGTYICVLENIYGRVVLEEKVIITGIVAPALAEMESEFEEIESVVGVDIELTCKVSLGNPTPFITWSKDGYNMDSNNKLERIDFHPNNSLIIQKADLTNVGSYKCEATNVGGSVSRHIYLTIIEPPILDSSDLLNLTEKVGNNALLPCHAYGTPLPEIQWLQSENNTIALTERISLTYEGLLIIGVRLEDAGRYTCVATNSAGSANRSVALTVQDPPHIVGETVTELVVNVGDVVRLPCTASGEPTPEYVWTHNYEFMDYNDHIFPSITSDGLVITSVVVNDGGEYLCSAINDVGTDNKTITVTVQEPPFIESADSVIVVTKGDSAQLMCKARGIPPPRIAWTFKGQPLLTNKLQVESDESILVLSNIQESDSGSYICTAYNLAGSDARAVRMVVQVPPAIEPWEQSLKLSEGQDLLLYCHMYGIPVPQGSWFKDGVSITPTDVMNSSIQYKVRAKLTDAGNYTCKAENIIGITSRSIQVSVFAPPRTLTPTNITISKLSEDDVSLDCITSVLYGYPEPTINWTFNGDPLIESNQNVFMSLDGNTLNIRKVLLSQSGVYECYVKNEAGNSSRNFNVVVHEPPFILDEFPNRKILMEGEDLSIPCSASGTPKPVLSWMFNNVTLSLSEDYDDLLLMKDNTLVIISAQANTSGLYTCVAQNEVGEHRQEIFIEVHVPVPLTRNNVIRKEVEEGDDIKLPCNAPDASTKEWEQDGVTIDIKAAKDRSDEAHFRLLDGGKYLEINEARPTDNGTYTCITSNPDGSETHLNYHLEVLWAPYFEEFGVSQKKFTVKEGNNVTFDCLSSGSPIPKVIWKINDSLPVTERTSPGVVVLPSSRHMLRIPIVRAHHDGIYKCQAINRLGSAYKTFILHVIVPPYIENDPGDHYEFLRGETVNLECPILGAPHPLYTWEHKRNHPFVVDSGAAKLQKNSQTLVIPNIDFSDGGLYVCNGSNQAGFKLKYFNVSIMEAPIIEDAEENEINALVGSPLSLVCTAHGQPLPDIQWTHNGHMLSLEDTTETSDLDTASVSQTLTLASSGATDSGKYVCHATNNRGTAEKVYRVHFIVPPRINGVATSVVENVTSVHGLPFSLHCHSSGEPMPVVSWLKEGASLKSDMVIKIDGTRGETLHFRHSSEEHSGNYTCIARNSAGSVSKTFLHDVLVPPYNPNNIEELEANVLRHKSFSLHCDFRGHPEPKLLWIKGIEAISVSNLSRGLNLTDNGRTLVITPTELSDAGRYSCLGYNEAGSAELMYHVKISEPPQRNEAITSNFTLVTLKPLRRFMFLCAMTGSPPPSIAWFKGGFPVENSSLNGTIQISSDGRQLHILSATNDHEGLYKCHGENAAGSTNAFFKLELDLQGDWGEWSDWGFCSVSCGFGTQERKRDCLTSNCPGETFETRPCFMSNCPINGGWSNWTEWFGCDQQCGQLKKNRSRECNNPEPAYGGHFCEGEAFEIENCNLPLCPVDGGWSTWSEWSACSVTCDAGVQIRHRECNSPEPAHGGQVCVGPFSDTKNCYNEPCFGSWSEWSEWSHCSATCGPGQRSRTRKCFSQWHDCDGHNKEFEYCKLRLCARNGPKTAHLYLHGSLNGYNFRDDTLYADIYGDEEIKRSFISTKLHNIRKREVPIQPIVPLLVSPISWNAAYEEKEARNGFSLTKGLFNQASTVHFATGQEMEMRHIGQGVDHAGQLKVDIEVIGEVPYVQPRATIVVQPFSEDFVQTGPNTLYITSEGTLSADGQVIPYLWNSTVSYNADGGAMPYLSEKMSTDHIISNYDHDLQEMRYTVSTVISKRFDDNKCPEGFILNPEQQHCEDVNECLDNASNKCHLTQVCENLLGSYRCTCPTGFRALNIGTRCLDVNECLQEPELCSHECRNVPGSYHCICPPGTYLLEDRHSCSASSYWDDPDETYGMSDVYGETSPIREAEKTPEDLAQPYHSQYDGPQEFHLAEEEWACGEGLVWRDGQCQDVDECLDDPDICGEDETCLNMHKTFKCLYTPCGEGFKRDLISRECIAVCSREVPCVSGAKQAEKKVFMALPLDTTSNQPGMDLVHLHISHGLVGPGKPYSHTKYYFVSDHRGKMFHLRQEEGSCAVFISKKLKPGKVYRVEVQGDMFSESTKTILFSTKFTLFFHVFKRENQ
ncbi:hemicentin-1-like isoform X2 [Thrips palmi]|uniref:Hemicentin-1-like isoform X2 n=1 Tax=Thrips palmi TaxID=161013 RepID=A0A6P8Y4V8_THRPL|nr:hemicentin-1-like isoform X2 [Thrips palmi]